MLFGKGGRGEKKKQKNQNILASYWSESLQKACCTGRGSSLCSQQPGVTYWEHMLCKPPHTLLYNIVGCACFLFLLVFSVYECSYASAFFFLRVTKKQLLIFVEGLNAEHCSLLALFNFGRALKMTRVYAVFPEQTPCCACVVASGRIHTNVLLWA